MHTTILDTHLHLYPCYDLSRAFDQFIDNANLSGPAATFVACLAERHDCDFYASLAQSDKPPAGFTVASVSSQEIELVRQRDRAKLTLLPGRQVISREKIEILSLACSAQIPDGQPAIDILYQIMQHGGVPVLPWSPGKWFGERGKLIKRLINELKAGDFLIGDTPLRPYGWPLPRLMKLARDKGFAIVAGSDPLPFKGEESWLGAYHSVVQSGQPCSATELVHLLKHDPGQLSWRNSGKRAHLPTLFTRLRKNAASKQPGKHSD